MAPAVATAKQQAELLKRDGNTCFGKERFGAAIEAYTEAITLCPNVAVYWTNRALCFRKRNEWTRVEEDCRKAIKLDSNSVKGHYMLGLALLQREEYAEGVKKLEKALDLGRGANPKGYMVEEIWQELSKAKYLTWEHSSSQRVWKLQTLKEECEKALEEKISSDVSLQTIGEGSDICSIVGFRKNRRNFFCKYSVKLLKLTYQLRFQITSAVESHLKYSEIRLSLPVALHMKEQRFLGICRRLETSNLSHVSLLTNRNWCQI